MSRTLLIILLVLAAAYLLPIVGLLAAGRRTDARAWAGFVPDCLILFKRLLGDRRVPRRRKALLVFAMTYLAMPIDLVPDFIPVAGQLDDAIVVAAVLRVVVRTAGLISSASTGRDRTAPCGCCCASPVLVRISADPDRTRPTSGRELRRWLRRS